MIETLINRQIIIIHKAEDNIQCSSNPPAGYCRGAGGLRSSCRRPSKRVVNDVRKPWWSMFGSGGERCSKEVVRKCHLQWSQMPYAMVANAICDDCKWHLQPTISEQRQPPFPNNGNHHISTTATTPFEQHILV
ncbi:MAG: hypothetical protein IJ269_03970 [Bacteroidales bacterium]|nr:hypothetical protein [Bacteroidales bacterium]